ncbi:MAG: cytochrome c [Planctomycetota bacterium]
MIPFKLLSKLPLAIALVALSAATACIETTQRRTLRSGMLEMDGDFRELRTHLGVPTKAERAKLLVARMRAWADEPVFRDRTESAVFQGNADNFRQHRELYVQRVDELAQAIETNDPRAMMAYARVNMSCEVCHAEFRPGL